VGHQSHCSFNLPTQPSNRLDSSQQSYDANKRPSSITEKEEEEEQEEEEEEEEGDGSATVLIINN
jgi:ribosomal protein L12E/L44/L45/RPP1/RPP2